MNGNGLFVSLKYKDRVWLLLAAVIVIASTLNSAQAKTHAAHAARTGITLSPTSKQSRGMVLDGAHHLWIAESSCDLFPDCAQPPTPGGIIAEYDATTLKKIREFRPPAPNIYNPIFLAIDGLGNVWFTDTSHRAIGKLVPGTNSWTAFPVPARFFNAMPYDLVLDRHGHLWFTDYHNGAIGEFDPVTNTMPGETPVPTAGAILYGITLAPDGTIWFTEDNNNAIGSFTPPVSGTLSTRNITEHTVLTNQQQMITVDAHGNVWFSTGYNGQIGELPHGSATALTFCVSQQVGNPDISGISVDNVRGRVWFNDTLNARIGYLDPAHYSDDCHAPNSSSAGVIDTPFNRNSYPADGLLADAQGNVFFTLESDLQVGMIPAGTALPPRGNLYPAGPSAKTWYFAEGRVGGGFSEFIALSNPDGANQCRVTIQYLQGSGIPVIKRVIIPPASRLTESVTSDMGTSVNGRGINVATIVTNDAGSLCQGFAAERPMYFNFFNIKSGSDVIGATHPANKFYFADILSGKGYASFIALLNPSGGLAAHVVAKYYASGLLVGTQSTTINGGTRGTLSAQSLHLPLHTAAVVQSDRPVVAERPCYFKNVSSGIAGSVSGASSLMGAQSVQRRWYVAEGTTGSNAAGGKTQEKLVISNVDPTVNAMAQVTINLQYPDGTMRPFTASVAAKSQLIWDVNAHNTHGTSNDVSATISSTDAGVVVERQMFFQYAYPAYNNTLLHATGVSDVTAQVGIYKSYSFAEGYTATGYTASGYDEWLTLQNPTANAETIYITLNSGYSRTFITSVIVKAHSRYTQSINSLVRPNLLERGEVDGPAYEVAMTVQSLDNSLFIAERTMYWNTVSSSFATQGGSDVFGYNGG